MTVKIALGTLAVVAALGIGAPTFAADNDMNKPADQPMSEHPMHHHAVHHHAMHHAMAHHDMHAHHMMHRDMSQDAKERAETKRLNEEQAHKGNM